MIVVQSGRATMINLATGSTDSPGRGDITYLDDGDGSAEIVADSEILAEVSDMDSTDPYKSCKAALSDQGTIGIHDVSAGKEVCIGGIINGSISSGIAILQKEPSESGDILRLREMYWP
jgi:hypothetical protein